MLSGLASINWNIWPPLPPLFFNLLLAQRQSHTCQETRSADLQLCYTEGHCRTVFWIFKMEQCCQYNLLLSTDWEVQPRKLLATQARSLPGNDSRFTLLSRLSEPLRCIGRLLRTLAIFLLLQTLFFWLQVKGNLSLVCPGDGDLKTCWPALLVVYIMFEIFLRRRYIFFIY